MSHSVTAEIAIDVDRLVIAVHRAVMQRHGEQIRTRVGGLGLDHPGYVYDLAEFIAAGVCTVDIARRRFPYAAGDLGGTLVAQLQENGLLDDRRQAMQPFADVVAWMVEARAVVAAELWDVQLGMAVSGAEQALTGAAGELVEAFRTLPQPSAEALRLHHLLTGLRYARLDAHIAAWGEEDLSASETVALRGAVATPGSFHPSPGLSARGWLTAEGAATPQAVAARARIEHRTNERCDSMFAELTDLEQWVAALRSLPPTH